MGVKDALVKSKGSTMALMVGGLIGTVSILDNYTKI